MIKCCECGEIFEDDEVESRSECVGEFWGSPAYMSIDVCPFCGSDEIEDYEEEQEEDEEDENDGSGEKD